MIKIFFKLIMLLLMVLAICFLIVNAPIKYRHDMATIKNRFELMSKKKGRKIILVGGSGLSVGVNSENISREFGYEVVNLGIYAGYGISYLLEKSKQYTAPGDIVIIVPEFQALWRESLWPSDKDTYKWLFVTDNYLGIKHLYATKSGYKLFLRDLSELFKDRIETIAYGITSKSISSIIGYGRIHNSGINAYGDVIIDVFNKIPYDKFEDYRKKYSLKEPSFNVVNYLNNYKTHNDANGIKTYFMYSCFPYEEFIDKKIQLDHMDSELRKNLKIQMIGDHATFIYSSNYFSNTCNHLTKDGRDMRTKRIIELLKKSLHSQSSI